MKEIIRRNIPNILTIVRGILGIIIFLFITKQNIVLMLAIFLGAILTDLFDGLLARKMKVVSRFGKLADPIADKILIVFFIFSITKLRELNIMEIPLLGKELRMMGLFWLFAISEIVIAVSSFFIIKYKKRDISANIFGKIKTATIFIVAIITLLSIIQGFNIFLIIEVALYISIVLNILNAKKINKIKTML
jgi:CDP-diacylglycerol--glycerol-3-phosphate 3-phosphatidyltransferase